MTNDSNNQRAVLTTLLCTRGFMAWIAVAVSFLVLDLIWLGIIGRPIYAELMGDLLRPEAYVPAAAIFYVFFVTTVYGYGVVGSRSPTDALKRGASLGFVTYATYELTNWAVITGWPALLVPIDIAWGIVLTGGASWVGYRVQPVETSES